MAIEVIRTFACLTEGTIVAKTATYDFARLMDDATEVKCSEFGDAIIKWMG